MSLPNEIEKVLRESGMLATAIATDATEAFERGELMELNVNKWLADQKRDRPHMWPSAGQVDLETAAFAQRNLTARSRLVRQLGEEHANERAKEWGLRDIHDMKSEGVPPWKVEDKNADADKKNNNPFLRANWSLTSQMALYKSDPALAGRLAKAAGVTIGAAHPVR
jgi:hypothetical protein